MRTSAFISTAALAMACAFSPVCRAGGDCKAAGRAILDFAAANGINRLSVLDFVPKGGAEKSEADYAAEEISASLAGHKKPALVERAQLEKVLKEARLASASGADAWQTGIFSVDAVVTGSVFASGEKLLVMAKLIDVRTGIVLMAARAEAERGWPRLSGMDGPGWEDLEPPPVPADLRDAVADKRDRSCAARKIKAAELNSELADDKARYWAGKMKEPGFTLRGLTRNPGSEISDPAVKARFYELLARYYEAGAAPPGAGQGRGPGRSSARRGHALRRLRLLVANPPAARRSLCTGLSAASAFPGPGLYP